MRISCGLRVERVDHRPRIASIADPGLLEVTLVLLGDRQVGEVEDADDALGDEVLNPDPAHLLLYPAKHLLLLG